ncbi:hypothetical protein EDB85DRAFT_948573 [Lactarius pseudohatsudake]|nr:hypothetical protein EDB85DRAFT_948573 [Lactarius pseudohatsudake]
MYAFSRIPVKGFWTTVQNQTIKYPQSLSGFGHFLDIMDGRNDVPGLANIKVAEWQMAVDALATDMTRFFELEFQRRDKGLEHLRDIFAARKGTTIPRISASAIDSAISDGHNVANNGTSSIFVEFKNSPTEISTVPQLLLLVDSLALSLSPSPASCRSRDRCVFDSDEI